MHLKITTKQTYRQQKFKSVKFERMIVEGHGFKVGLKTSNVIIMAEIILKFGGSCIFLPRKTWTWSLISQDTPKLQYSCWHDTKMGMIEEEKGEESLNEEGGQLRISHKAHTCI